MELTSGESTLAAASGVERRRRPSPRKPAWSRFPSPTSTSPLTTRPLQSAESRFFRRAYGWLHGQQIGLRDLRQDLVDEWIAAGATTTPIGAHVLGLAGARRRLR
jgi:hypothetical protein